jgi:predicted dehydrogenase
MPPIRLSRRKFLGASAAAGLALSQGQEVGARQEVGTVRVGIVGLGGRGTNLLRTLAEMQGVEIVAVADPEPKHGVRAQGIAEKATGKRPDYLPSIEAILDRADMEAVVTALPCDLHAEAASLALRASKHVYAEKPMGLTVADCDALIEVAGAHPDQALHLGFQRRSHPRYRAAADLVARGEFGELVEGRVSWTSSNGPVQGHQGWLGKRERSGDWMVEQAVHVWDLFHWLKGAPPVRAYGHGRRDRFASVDPGRDVTDTYFASLEWADGFRLSYHQSWADPADDAFTGQSLLLVGQRGGIDLVTGTATFRDRSLPRQTLHPGHQPDTRLALEAFLASCRSPGSVPPVTLADAREATVTGLLVRRAVDERRVVDRSEIV